MYLCISLSTYLSIYLSIYPCNVTYCYVMCVCMYVYMYVCMYLVLPDTLIPNETKNKLKHQAYPLEIKIIFYFFSVSAKDYPFNLITFNTRLSTLIKS